MFFLSAVSLLLLWSILWMARAKKIHGVGGTVVDPLLFVFLLLLFFNIDYWILFSDSSSMQMFEVSAVESYDEVVYSYFVFVLYSAAAVFGIYLGWSSKVLPLKTRIRALSPGGKTPAVIFSLVMLAGMYSMSFLAKDIGSIVSAEISRQLYFKDNPMMHLVFLLSLPAYSIYLSSKPRFDKVSFFWLIFLVLLLLLSGSRGAIILLFIISAVDYCLKNKKLSWKLLVVAIPVVVCVLVVVRYAFREAWRYDSIWQFLDSSGGLLGVFFQSSEVSLAEVMTMAVMNESKFDVYPFQGLIGLLSYPIPRAIFPYKPLSASGYFTEYVSPDRWDTARSEILVTGFGNVYLEFGAILGVAVIFVLAYAWMRGVRRSLVGGTSYVFFYPFLLWLCYIFVRGDFFNMGSTVWAVFLVLLLGQLLGTVSRVRIFR